MFLTSSFVRRPFHYVEVAIPAEIENIHAARVPKASQPRRSSSSSNESSRRREDNSGGGGGDTILLYYGEHDFVFPNATCTGDNRTKTHTNSKNSNPPTTPPAIAAPRHHYTTPVGGNPYPRHDDRIGIAISTNSFKGPWTKNYPTYNANMKPYLPLTNPSPHILKNGTVLLAFRYALKGLPETNGLAVADSWRGPYSLVSAAAAPVPENSEDPFLFANSRGLHMIYHCYRGARNPPNETGCHAYSADGGAKWTVSPYPVYNTTVPMQNGATQNFDYRERPEILFNKDGTPQFLLTGVETGLKDNDYPNCSSASIVTPILA